MTCTFARSVALALSATALAGCGNGAAPSSPTTTTTPTPTPITNGYVTVSGTHFMRNGVVWVPHGINSVAFVPSPSVRTGLFGQAFNNFNAAELAAMKAWGADTIRFQVAQPALDKNDPLYDPAFLGQVVQGVTAARAIGLNAIVSIQDESGTGEPVATPLPNAGTGYAWSQLAPAFKGDPGILFEIMNEPQPSNDAAGWAAWATAMNAMVTIIRNSGATNVLIADGLNFAERLDGAPTLADPLHQVAYAAHPYAHSAADQTPGGNGQPNVGWDAKFGNVSVTPNAPVIVTEWSLENTPTPPNQNFQYCGPDSPQAALNLLGYLNSKGIGLMVFSYDLPNQPNVPRVGRAVVDSIGTPSSLANGLGCTDATFGPGTIVQNWYRTGTVPTALQ